MIVLMVDRYDDGVEGAPGSRATGRSRRTRSLIRIEDKPGALAKIAVRLKDADARPSLDAHRPALGRIQHREPRRE